jgi:hypothetical protein
MGMEHDNAVDKVLAALRDAVPPEGMHARIAQRLAQEAATTQDTAFRWRNLFAGSSLAGAWWRGALSGAAVAMIVTGAVLFAGHLLRPRTLVPDSGQLAVRETVSPTATPVAATHTTPASEDRARPCISPNLPRVRNVVPTPSDEKLLAESRDDSAAPSHPAPALALTAQERGLVRLVRTSDPKELGTLNSETQAKLQAKDEADFDKFFAPPAPAPTTNNNE